MRIFPFILSAALFFSGFFTFFAPLPLLVAAFQPKKIWFFLTVASNTALVLFLGGFPVFAVYTVFILSLVLGITYCLSRRSSLEKTALIALVVMGVVGLAWIGAEARIHHVAPVTELKTQVDGLTSALLSSLPPDTKKGLLGNMDPSEWRKGFALELPSDIAIAGLFLIWANLLLLLRLNPSHLRERLGLEVGFFRKWKAPEWMVWPTIACGAFLLKDSWGGLPWPTHVALNGFRLLMAIYAIQGLSILAFAFETWHFRGIFRTLGYLVAALFMMPLVLSLGFFDLWFDFRGKLRQS